MALFKGDQPQAEDIEHDNATLGEDSTDSYEHTSGFIYVLRKNDHTGYPTDHYKIEVHPKKRAKTRGNRFQQLIEVPVTNMCKAERDLREIFGYACHKSTEEGCFMADSPEEVKSKCHEVLEQWKNTQAEETAHE